MFLKCTRNEQSYQKLIVNNIDNEYHNKLSFSETFMEIARGMTMDKNNAVC